MFTSTHTSEASEALESVTAVAVRACSERVFGLLGAALAFSVTLLSVPCVCVMSCDANPVAEPGTPAHTSADSTAAVNSSTTDQPASRVGVCRDGVKEVAPRRFEVDRDSLSERLQDLDRLSRQIRVIPHYQRGKPAGFKIVGIRSKSVFRSMGFKSGDVLKSVAGGELNSIRGALQLFEKLRLSELASLEITFERDTHLISHHYDFVNSADCKQSRKELNQRKSDVYKNGIKEVSPGRYEVDRAMLDEQFADLDSIIRQARVIPHYNRGKPAGFKIVGIRSNSIFKHLGFKSGDVLKSVGGEELTSINKAMRLFEQLSTSSHISLEIERRGQRLSYHYEIK